VIAAELRAPYDIADIFNLDALLIEAVVVGVVVNYM